MSDFRNKPKGLHEIAEELVNNHLNDSAGTRRDVSNELRIPKGDPQGGEWTTSTSTAQASGKATAIAQGKTVTITHADGSIAIRHGGSRAWRNNNPGNIEAGPRANAEGAIGSDGRFAIFPNEATGETALEAELERRSSLTIDQAIAARTPAKDKNNDTPRTQKQVRDFSGLSGDAIIGDLTPAEKQRLYGAIRRAEGWQPGSVTNGIPSS